MSSARTASVVARVERLAAALRARLASMATAESCTGGLVAAACTSRAGSSAWFERGVVTYSNAAKSELLGVPAALIVALILLADRFVLHEHIPPLRWAGVFFIMLGIVLALTPVYAAEALASPSLSKEAAYGFLEGAIGGGNLIGGFLIGIIGSRLALGKMVILGYVVTGALVALLPLAHAGAARG